MSLACSLARADVTFHVDVNVGDPRTPTPQRAAIPKLLGGELHVLGYPLAMVHAEKIVTAIGRGVANTRWRDFGDLYVLSRRHDVVGAELATALATVATHREIELRPARVRPGWLRRARPDPVPGLAAQAPPRGAAGALP